MVVIPLFSYYNRNKTKSQQFSIYRQNSIINTEMHKMEYCVKTCNIFYFDGILCIRLNF